LYETFWGLQDAASQPGTIASEVPLRRKDGGNDWEQRNGKVLMRHTKVLVLVATLCSGVAIGQQPITIRAGTLLDGKGGLVRNTTVVIQGSKIVKIDPSIKNANYDLSDLTVMPGWIETHAHIAAHFDRETGRAQAAKGETKEQATLYLMENAYQTLMAGFTTVQSPGAAIDKYLRDFANTGPLPSPRILTSLGSIHDGTPDEIRARVDKFVADGADFIKFFATKSIREGGGQTMSFEQLEAGCGEAKKLGKRTLIHAQGPEGAKAAILAGCTSIEHGNRLTDEVLDLMVQRGTYFDSNNGILIHNYLENRGHYFGIGNYNAEGFTFLEKGLAPGADTLRRAIAKHVKIVFGTDGMPGTHGRNFEEFIYRVHDSGQRTMDAMIAAQSMAAESIGMKDQIGTIAPGMQADIIATQGSPIDDITNVRKVVFVMRGGRVFKNTKIPEPTVVLSPVESK
jgi:imidazolonepropionase-like amidohydrolase